MDHVSDPGPAVENRTLKNIAAGALIIGAVAYLTAGLRLYDLVSFAGARFIVVEFLFFVVPIPAMWIASAMVGLRSDRYVAFAAGIAIGLATWGIATSLGQIIDGTVGALQPVALFGSGTAAVGGLLLLVTSMPTHAEPAGEIGGHEPELLD
jgi:hypothetical protein